jgi:hypothetical protein
MLGGAQAALGGGAHRVPPSFLVPRLFIVTSIGPYFPLAGGFCKFYANARPIQRQPLLVHYKQPANPPLSKNNYTSLVDTGNIFITGVIDTGDKLVTGVNTTLVLTFFPQVDDTGHK